MAPLLNRAAARLGNGSPGTQITVHCPDGFTVHAAEGQLERAVTYMVHNALRHGAAPIEITAALRAGQAEVHVRDRGAGFPPAFLPAAFDRFTRTDDARSGPGTGLGLAITAAVARAVGGSRGAANRPGGGADVWISLPATTSHAAGMSGQHGTLPPAGRTRRTRDDRVLPACPGPGRDCRLSQM